MDALLVLSVPRLQRQSPGLGAVSLDLLSSLISSCENLHFHASQCGTIKCERTVRFLVTPSHPLRLGVQFGFLHVTGVPIIAKQHHYVSTYFVR